MTKEVDYEHMIGVQEETKQTSLVDFLGMDETAMVNSKHPNHADNHWKDMPEFVNEKKETFRTIYVHFRNQEDVDEFEKLIGQKFTPKTKSIWHPRLEKNDFTLTRWIDEEPS